MPHCRATRLHALPEPAALPPSYPSRMRGGHLASPSCAIIDRPASAPALRDEALYTQERAQPSRAGSAAQRRLQRSQSRVSAAVADSPAALLEPVAAAAGAGSVVDWLKGVAGVHSGGTGQASAAGTSAVMNWFKGVVGAPPVPEPAPVASPAAAVPRMACSECFDRSGSARVSHRPAPSSHRSDADSYRIGSQSHRARRLERDSDRRLAAVEAASSRQARLLLRSQGATGSGADLDLWKVSHSHATYGSWYGASAPQQPISRRPPVAERGAAMQEGGADRAGPLARRAVGARPRFCGSEGTSSASYGAFYAQVEG